MKAKHIVVYLLLAIVSSSCIREEALNAEADILSCILPGVAMTTSPIINNNSITIFVGPGTDISELKPEFTLTPGAAISPLSGTERNFNTPQEYTVTAADGVWKKMYTVSVIDTELATNYNSKIHWAERSTTYLWNAKEIRSSWNGPAEMRVMP